MQDSLRAGRTLVCCVNHSHEWYGPDGICGRAMVCVLAVQAKICAQLDSALLTDEELQMYNTKWASLPDPVHAGAEQQQQQQL
jgi:hypothetical protein